MTFKRIIVVGCSCTGKSSTAKLIESKLGLKYTDIDNVHWKPNWIESTDDELLPRLDAITNEESWVLAGNYGRTNHITWPKADCVVWLNYPFPVVFRQAIYRTLKRIWTQEDICNGNKETFWKQFFTTDSILYWVIKTHKTNQERYQGRIKEKTFGELPIFEFHDHYEVRNWVDSLASLKA